MINSNFYFDRYNHIDANNTEENEAVYVLFSGGTFFC